MKTLDAHYRPPEGTAIKGEAFKGVPPEGNVIVRTVCVGKWFDAGWHATQSPGQFELHDNYVTTDDKAVGAAADGFAVPADSLAWKTGFKPIPFNQIGVISNEDRARLARSE